MSRLLFQALIISKLICEANAIRSSKEEDPAQYQRLYLRDIPVGCSGVIDEIVKEYKEVLKIDVLLTFIPPRGQDPYITSFSSRKDIAAIIKKYISNMKKCSTDGVRFVIPSICKDKSEAIELAKDKLRNELKDKVVEVIPADRGYRKEYMVTKSKSVTAHDNQIETTRKEIAALCNLPV